MEKYILKHGSASPAFLNTPDQRTLSLVLTALVCALLGACQSISLNNGNTSWSTKEITSSPSAPLPTSTQASSSPPNANMALSPLPSNALSSRSVTHLSLPNDIWERVRKGFAMPDLQSDLVTDREVWYSAKPDYLVRMTERSTKYMYFIVEELER